MVSLTTYEYQVLVTETRDEKGEVVRPAQIVEQGKDLLERPKELKILLGCAEKLAKFTGEKAITDPESEVVVNIRPFCG